MQTIIVTWLSYILQLYWYAIFARVLLSWFPNVQSTVLGRFFIAVTEPYLAPFRRLIPPLSFAGGYLDLSVIVAVILYMFVENGLLWVVQVVLGLLGVQ